jgi:ABC-2 type transport system permease protein
VNFSTQWVGFSTIVIKEMKRVLRLWMQTLLPPVVTSTLYFMIFGHVIGRRVGDMAGFSYIQFIAPGLIVMQLIAGSYASAVSSFFGAKFVRSIEELLVSPMSNLMILLGFMTGGIFRGLIVGFLVSLVAIFFTHLSIHSLAIIVFVALLTSAIFSCAGIINAVYAKKFDDISIIPTFVLTPLTYLGGVFYSIKMLTGVWHYVSMANPIVYIVSSFRFGFLGFSEHQFAAALFAMILLLVALLFFALYLFKHSAGLRQ